MSNIAIEFNNVGKMYRLGRVGTGTLSHDLNRWWTTTILRKEDPYLKIGETNDRSKKGSSEYVWALRDISFKVEQGDVIGIIGKNGAGKSTLLKLLSRITSPTTGSIRYQGRIASLLEVGTGFHPEMTGRENIYMNGSIMGMTKKEITRKLDEIVDFAGVERYIDTPVKRYSSGMTVRLGFAVAAFLEPEILVVDEVLTVGDAEFQKKAIGKMKNVSEVSGRTVLFVSHNMASMQRLCNNGVLLENGCLKYCGGIGDTIKQYLADEIIQKEFQGIDGEEKVLFLSKAKVYSDSEDGVIYNDKSIFVEYDIILKTNIPSLVCGFNLYSVNQTPLARADYNDRSQETTLPIGAYHMKYRIPPYTLADGDYSILFDVAERNVKRYTTEKSILTFNVQQGESGFGNIFAEKIPIKSSIIHADWLDSIS